MKKISSVLLLLILFFLTIFGQNPVPPVQQADNDTLIINPDPNSGSAQGQQQTNSSQVAQGKNAISVIVDYSGSMEGDRIQAAKRSTITLLELISLWEELYPDRIGDLYFQFIQFGGKNEHNILHDLSEIDNYDQLKQKIRESKADYKNTDYNRGIIDAVKNLKEKGIDNNKTLFISDGLDHGDGPESGINYNILGDTKFIIFCSSKSGKVGVWEKEIQYASEINLNDPFQVTSIFVATLFEYVDDINRYLVRRGKEKIGSSSSFNIYKNSSNTSHNLVLSRPNPNLEINNIVDENGSPLDTSQYNIYERSAFFQIFLQNGVPQGKYKIYFKGIKKDAYINYINFERTDIYLKMFSVPELDAGECFVEHSSVNFEFKYWDNDHNREVRYEDFLKSVAYRFEISNSMMSRIGTDLNELKFKKSFSTGTAGHYDVRTSWNYNIGKLKNNEPPLQKVGEFCIDKNGSLVHVDFDTNQTWEGRNLRFTAQMTKPNPAIIENINTLTLNNGENDIILEQQGDQNKYIGTWKNITPGFYQLSIENQNSNYNLAIDSSTVTQFDVKKRSLIFKIEGIDYSNIKRNLNFWDKIGFAWKDMTGKISKDTKLYNYTADHDINIKYKLPYKNRFKENVAVKIKINRQFPDEKVNLKFKSFGDSVFSSQNAKNGAHVRKFFGLIRKKAIFDEAVKVNVNIPPQVLLRPEDHVEQSSIYIHKKEAEMYFANFLQEEPGFTFSGSVENTNNNTSTSLDQHKVTLEIETSETNRWLYKIANIGLYILVFILLLIILFTVLLGIILYLRRRNTKLEIWERCKLKSPEDFFKNFPVKFKNKISRIYQDNKNDIDIGNPIDENIQNKRILRYIINNEEYNIDKYIAKYFTIEELEALEKKLESPNKNYSWQFTNLKNYEMIEITNCKSDMDKMSERTIRTRIDISSNYGKLEIRNKSLVFINNQTIAKYTDIRDTSELSHKDEITVRENGLIEFGYNLEENLFKARIERINLSLGEIIIKIE